MLAQGGGGAIGWYPGGVAMLGKEPTSFAPKWLDD